MKLHLRDDMDISKYRLNKFVDKLVDKAIDKINNSLNCKDLDVVTYRKPVDSTKVCIEAPVNYSERTEAAQYITNTVDRDDRGFYIWVKQNKHDKQTYIHSDMGYGNHYARYFDDLDELTSYVMDELVPKVVNNVNKAYADYVNKYDDMTESLDESSMASSLNEWDIETIASMIEDWLYDRNFIVDRRKIWGNTIDFTVSYKYDDSHDTVTVYAKDFENLPEDEWFNLARTKAEEIAEIVLDN